MKSFYSKLIIVLMIIIISLILNFKYEYKPTVQTLPAVKKVIVIKKVYIRIPTPVDSIHSDTTIILPKQPLALPGFDVRKFYRSRNLHKKNVFIS
jgi:hypothetical protein